MAKEYLDLTKLDNAAGTGWLPTLLATEQDLFKQTADFLEKPAVPSEMAAFQKAAAERALATLKKY